LQERLIINVAAGYASANPEAAAEWLRQSFPPGETLDNGLAGVLNSWVTENDPTKAAHWILGLPQGSTRDHALKNLVTTWKESDPDGLTKWLEALPHDNLRNEIEKLTN
jgi:hypothetical protein